ncbi:SURF1 family protein [Frigoribacterium sp. VKM Ac-1396]|uniref:SURF1 family cytochrome oxidase biogenesis protein n=1 Tax=Frigoribacterium sp. VKM Ac-1396 TaxID=2783821 RepID=UPI00188DC381|nr:SURF1 family protein [Frigoribacterium sp. VKM Ac-1396]
MTNIRFALSRRWLGYFAVAVVFAIVCVFLAHWQWSRHDEKLAVVHQIEQTYDADPVPLAQALPDLSSYDAAQEWQPVEMTGRYLADDELLVRNRPLNGQPGFEVLVPFRTTQGDVFVVDRGWVPTGNAQDSPDVVPAPPSGDVTVVARLKPGEPTVGDRTGVPGTNQIATIQLSEVESRVGQPIYSAAYGLIVSESPATATAPVPSTKPEVDTGLNLSYFVQWLMFAVGAFGFLFYVFRQEYRNQNADDEELVEREAERQRRRDARPRHDNDVEDEILDGVRR